ncbi:MAG: hypothetical protein IID32_08310 [Planctomycetes bacterium]|nr:hypothetical protein [Planctomycetota bacterium]
MAWSRSDNSAPNVSKSPKASPLWNLTDWELLKLPESKEVVRFTHPGKNQNLYVYLLVTRQKMTIEQMLQARKNYWQQFTNQVTLSEARTVTVSDRPAVTSTILWHPQKKNWRRLIRETVIQKEKNRYFLLAFVTSLTTPDSESADILLTEAISNNFVFFSESDFQLRRGKARIEAQTLLAEWSSSRIKEILQNKCWYRIVHQGLDVGFHYVQESVKILPEKKHRIDVTYNDYVANAQAFALYANMMGVRIAPPPGETGRSPSTGPVQAWLKSPAGQHF